MRTLRLDAPSEKQEAFLSDTTHKYIAYGGARGGGKTWAVRVKAALLALRYAGIQILIIRRITGDQVCGSLDNGFVDVRGLDTVIKLNVGAQLDLGNRNVMQSFCRPIQNAMDFVEIDALCATVALCHQQILIHVCRTCFWNSFRNSFMQTTCSTGSCLEHYI